MLYYTSIYLFNAIGLFVKKSDKRIINSIVIVLLVLLTGTRYRMGGHDILVYEQFYKNVPDVGTVIVYMFTGVNNGVNTNYEVGYSLLNSIIKSLGFSFYGYLLIWTFLFYILMVKGLEEFVEEWAPFWCFFMYKIMFYDTFVCIRQGLTIAMFCFMLRYIRDRKWYFYFPWCFLAILEHRAALIFIPLYWIIYFPITKKFIITYSLVLLPTWIIRDYININDMITRIVTFIGNEHNLQLWFESPDEIRFIHVIELYSVICLVILFYDYIIQAPVSKF